MFVQKERNKRTFKTGKSIHPWKESFKVYVELQYIKYLHFTVFTVFDCSNYNNTDHVNYTATQLWSAKWDYKAYRYYVIININIVTFCKAALQNVS